MTESTRGENDPFLLTDLDRIQAICDRFEADWWAGGPHRVEEELGKVPERLRKRLFDALQARELELRQTQGQRPHPRCDSRVVERGGEQGDPEKTPDWECQDIRPIPAPVDLSFSTRDARRAGNAVECTGDQATLAYSIVRRDGRIEPLLGPEHYRLLETAFRPGVLIQDRYHIDRELGQGGMGRVYLAMDVRLDRPVAVKISLLLGQDRELSEQQIEELRQSFAEEARFGANLTHPAIATVYDYGFHGDMPFTVFEYLHGQTLRELLRSRGRLTLDEVRLIIGPLAQALDFAHSRHVVHRDLKPENVRATEQGLFKILDLGLAKDFQRDADWRGFAGTPAYATPEQASGKACDGRTDQYALALVTFELLTGWRLFESRDPLVLLDLHRDAPPTRINDAPPDIPASIRLVLIRALSKNPNDRFATCSDLAASLGCQLLNVPASTAEILRETDVNRMTIGRIGSRRKWVHQVLTRDRLWSVYHTEINDWPLQRVSLVRVSHRTLWITFQQDGGAPLLRALRFASPNECISWAESLGQVRSKLAVNPASTESDNSSSKMVVLLRGRPNLRYQVLGPLEAQGKTRRSVRAGLEVRAAIGGSDAVIEVEEECMPGFQGSDRRIAGIAVKAVDPQGRFEFRSRWYFDRVTRISSLAIGLVMTYILLDVIGHWPKFILQVATTCAVPLGLVCIVRMLRWPQLVCPMIISLVTLALRPGFFLVAVFAGALWTGNWVTSSDRLKFYYQPLMLPISWPFTISLPFFGLFLARTAWETYSDFRRLVPRAARRGTALRSVTSVLAWIVAVSFAVFLPVAGVLTEFQLLGQEYFSKQIAAAEAQLQSGYAVLSERPTEALAATQPAVDQWEDIVRDFPSDPGCRSRLGLAYLYRAHAHLAVSMIVPARVYASRAKAIFKGLVADPNSTAAERDWCTTSFDSVALLEARILINEAHLASDQGDQRATEIAYREALAQLETGLRIQSTPSDERDSLKGMALNGLAWCTVRQQSPAPGDLERALELAHQAVRLVPRNALAWKTLGVAQFRFGSYTEALVSLTRSTSLPGGGAPADFTFLAMTQHRLGRIDEARVSLDRLHALAKKGSVNLGSDDALFLLEAEKLVEGPKDHFPRDVFAR